MPERRDVVAGVGDHLAPGGDEGGDAEAKEAEGGLGQDHRAERERGRDDHRRDRVGQNVAEHDADVAGADGARGIDKVALADAEHFAADEAGVADPRAHAQKQDDVEEPAADEGHGRDEEHEEGDGRLRVSHPHDDVAGETAAVTCDQAHHDAGGDADDSGRGADEQRNAGADEDPAEDIAAEVVGAHEAGPAFKVQPGRFGKSVAEVDGNGVVRGEQRAENGHEGEAEKEEAADDALAVGPGFSPHASVRAAGE